MRKQTRASLSANQIRANFQSAQSILKRIDPAQIHLRLVSGTRWAASEGGFDGKLSPHREILQSLPNTA